MKELHSEIPNLKHKLLSSESTIKNNLKIKQLKTEQLSTQTFSRDKIRSKSHQNSSKCLSVEKVNVLLKCLLPYTHLIVYSKHMGSGIQITVKANELSSVMTVYTWLP